MAKGQKRSGREPKKPKKDKLKVPATASSQIAGRISPGAYVPNKKK